MTKPHINVTPLIDVLLVLLIIFMVVTPTKPSSFKAKIPSEPTRQSDVEPNPQTIIVTLDRDSSLTVNNERIGASVEDTAKLIERLSGIFAARQQNQAFVEGTTEVQRTVFIKAPRGSSYGSVAKVVDAVKAGGAQPISLQVDDLD